MYKDMIRHHKKSYLQERLVNDMPALMDKVFQNQNGLFIFEHPKFPDFRIEGLTMTFVQENLERVIKKQLMHQSDKHIDYVFALLLS